MSSVVPTNACSAKPSFRLYHYQGRTNRAKHYSKIPFQCLSFPIHVDVDVSTLLASVEPSNNHSSGVLHGISLVQLWVNTHNPSWSWSAALPTAPQLLCDFKDVRSVKPTEHNRRYVSSSIQQDRRDPTHQDIVSSPLSMASKGRHALSLYTQAFVDVPALVSTRPGFH